MEALLVTPRCYPKDDADFCAFIGRLVAQANGDVDRIRPVVTARYPEAQLVAQSPLGSVTGLPTIVYAYRDGHPLPPDT